MENKKKKNIAKLLMKLINCLIDSKVGGDLCRLRRGWSRGLGCCLCVDDILHPTGLRVGGWLWKEGGGGDSWWFPFRETGFGGVQGSEETTGMG